MQLADIAVEHGMHKPLIVCDSGIVDHNLLDDPLIGFARQGMTPSVYSGVVMDPPETVVHEAVETARTDNCDGIVGFGGGSSMDVAKLVAALLPSEQSLNSMYGVDKISGGRLPLIQVPTTAGTGSEATSVAIVTVGKSAKSGVVSDVLYADHVILDPKLTLDLPADITAATGVDAMVHAIEAFTSKRLKNPMSDMLAMHGLRLLFDSIRTAVAQGDNMAARSDMLLGALFAGQAFSNAPVGAVHALAYPLGGVYHIPHGLSNSLLLPHVLRFNAPNAASLYREIAEVIMPQFASIEDSEEMVDYMAEYFFTLAKGLGLPTSLREVNIPESDLAALAEGAMQQQRLLINNPREVSQADALDIYRAAY